MAEHRAAPSAASLIEAMRDIGYTLETAIADVIDNAITAGAQNIEIVHDVAGDKPFLAVVDDGDSMDQAGLLAAMRPGSLSPTFTRASTDLGRFGLGMKTASFSQARSLTVICKQGGAVASARWDLDYVVERDDWLLLLPPSFDPTTYEAFEKIGTSGTAVIWEKLDRLADATSGASHSDHMLDRLDSARRHLELVFHRFLTGEPNVPRIRISINGHELKPFDPFNTASRATTRLPVEPIKVGGQVVTVEAFVLPHHGKVSVAEWERFAGEGGYLKNQGFYVYRGGRLIIHGTWFRLAKQSELTKLARVKIDMPNTLDAFWKIDVRKASAQPPYIVRERLRGLIDQIAGPARRVYTAKGHKMTAESRAALWHRRVDKGAISYEVNRDHPALINLGETLDDRQANDLERLLRAIESSFPVDAAFSDSASDPKAISQGKIDEEDLSALISVTVRALARVGVPLEAMLRDLQRTEPYRTNWGAAEPIVRAAYAQTGSSEEDV